MQGGRKENQDDIGFVETPLGFLLILCDGMGGGPGGRTASGMAKTEMARFLYSCNPSMPRTEALREAVNCTQNAMKQAMEYNRALMGMGTTLVAVLINKQSALIAHLGDSRCYRVRNGKMRYRSNDHSLVGELVRNKVLSEEEARCSPQSNVITRGLGSVSNNVPEIDDVPYRKGDRFVVCTDGVWGVMPHADLLNRIAAPVEMNTLANNLASEIEKIGFAAGGHHDNHTFAIIEMDLDSIMKDKMDKTTKIVLAVMGALLFISILLNIIFSAKGLTARNEGARAPLQPSQNDVLAQEYISKVSDESYKKVLVELMDSKAALQDENAMLHEKIDSLEKELNALKTVGKRAEALTGALGGSCADGKNATDVIDEALKKLNEMLNVKVRAKSKDDSEALAKASGAMNKYRKDVEGLVCVLADFDNEFSETDSIKSDLAKKSNVECSICLVGYKDGYFTPNTTANKLIQEQIKRLKRIKSQMSC